VSRAHFDAHHRDTKNAHADDVERGYCRNDESRGAGASSGHHHTGAHHGSSQKTRPLARAVPGNGLPHKVGGEEGAEGAAEGAPVAAPPIQSYASKFMHAFASPDFERKVVKPGEVRAPLTSKMTRAEWKAKQVCATNPHTCWLGLYVCLELFGEKPSATCTHKREGL